VNRWTKWAVVAGGYGAAVGAGAVAGWLYDARMAAQPYDTSGGMYAAGQSLSALAVFLVVALARTIHEPLAENAGCRGAARRGEGRTGVVLRTRRGADPRRNAADPRQIAFAGGGLMNSPG
jgi:hypothetical protein